MAVAKGRTVEVVVLDGRTWRLVQDATQPSVAEAFPEADPASTDGLRDAFAKLLVGAWMRRRKGLSDG